MYEAEDLVSASFIACKSDHIMSAEPGLSFGILSLEHSKSEVMISF